MRPRRSTGILALALAATTLAAAAPAPTGPTHAFKVAVAPGELLHVESTGTGEPVVFIPGLFGCAFSFRKVVQPLAEAGYHAIVVEPLGVGASGRPEDADYSLEAQAQRVAAVLDSLDITHATVVAHSVGASVAFRLAAEHPVRIRRIVSIEGGPAESAGTPGLRHALKFAGVLRFFGLGGSIEGKLRSSLEKASGDRSWITDDVVARYVAPFHDDLGTALRTYKAMASAHEPLPLAPRLDQVRVPVTLLLGGAPHDGAPDDEEIRLLQDSIPSLRIVRVPGAGNWLQEERPDVVIDAVRTEP